LNVIIEIYALGFLPRFFVLPKIWGFVRGVWSGGFVLHSFRWSCALSQITLRVQGRSAYM